MKRILLLAVCGALVVAAPADAKTRSHKGKTKVAVVQGNPKPIIEVPYPGAIPELYGGPGQPKVSIFSPLDVATGLGNKALGQLGLPGI
jgi:hypothetical protein